LFYNRRFNLAEMLPNVHVFFGYHVQFNEHETHRKVTVSKTHRRVYGTSLRHPGSNRKLRLSSRKGQPRVVWRLATTSRSMCN